MSLSHRIFFIQLVSILAKPTNWNKTIGTMFALKLIPPLETTLSNVLSGWEKMCRLNMGPLTLGLVGALRDPSSGQLSYVGFPQTDPRPWCKSFEDLRQSNDVFGKELLAWEATRLKYNELWGRLMEIHINRQHIQQQRCAEAYRGIRQTVDTIFHGLALSGSPNSVVACEQLATFAASRIRQSNKKELASSQVWAVTLEVSKTAMNHMVLFMSNSNGFNPKVGRSFEECLTQGVVIDLWQQHKDNMSQSVQYLQFTINKPEVSLRQAIFGALSGHPTEDVKAVVRLYKNFRIVSYTSIPPASLKRPKPCWRFPSFLEENLLNKAMEAKTGDDINKLMENNILASQTLT